MNDSIFQSSWFELHFGSRGATHVTGSTGIKFRSQNRTPWYLFELHG